MTCTGIAPSASPDVSPLLVRLAGVELTPEGKMWLQENLAPAETVWLKLISREEDTLHCLVSHGRVRHLTHGTHEVNLSLT